MCWESLGLTLNRGLAAVYCFRTAVLRRWLIISLKRPWLARLAIVLWTPAAAIVALVTLTQRPFTDWPFTILALTVYFRYSAGRTECPLKARAIRIAEISVHSISIAAVRIASFGVSTISWPSIGGPRIPVNIRLAITIWLIGAVAALMPTLTRTVLAVPIVIVPII